MGILFDFRNESDTMGIDVNDPGDLRFLNEAMGKVKLVECAGWGDAEKEEVVVVHEDGDVFRMIRLHCPGVCPRDEVSVKERCGIEYETN